jgi:hypothetical protein
MGFSRFDMGNLYPQAEALDTTKPGLGTQLGVPNSNQVPLSHGVPIFTAAGYSGTGGPSSIPTIRLENTFNPVANFTWIRGRHTVKFGTNLIRRQIIDFQANQGNGAFSFTRTFTGDPNNAGSTGDGIATFLLGAYSSMSQDHQLVWAGYRAGNRLLHRRRLPRNSRLTLNLGLRYEYVPPPVEVADRMMNLDIATGKVKIASFNSDRNVGNIQSNNSCSPRASALPIRLPATPWCAADSACSITPRQRRRPVSHAPLPPFAASNSVAVDEFSANYPQVQAGLPPIPIPGLRVVSNNPVGNFLTVPSNYRPAHAMQFNLGLQEQLPGTPW